MNVVAVKEVASSGELIWNLALRELRGRYKRSALGWFWSLLNPLFTMVIYTIVFSRILRATPPPGNPSGLDVFGLYLLCGLLPWNFFSITVTTSMATLLGNGSLIKKVYFPREVLVLSVTRGRAGHVRHRARPALRRADVVRELRRSRGSRSCSC